LTSSSSHTVGSVESKGVGEDVEEETTTAAADERLVVLI
jgi:hypothetical protein